MEQILIELLQEYGYIILFVWSILEGETGLVMAGVMIHTGDMVMINAIIVAGLGGFAGDQLYFYIGRYNQKLIHSKLISQRRKFALATLLLRKYGWMIIFAQRYMYGLRTIIPMAIGLTKYNSKTFGIINLISAFIWASLTIILSYIFGKEILKIVHFAKEHWQLALPLVLFFLANVFYFFHKKTKKDNI
jgi:membrane protein DedA with SNARE-associated domain